MKSAAAVRAVFFLHRYAGIALCLLMLSWCLSGVVMLYVPYPSLGEGERLGGLAPLDWRGCCTLPEDFSAPFAIEMFDGRPVLRTSGAAFDLRSGAPLTVSPLAALRAAQDFAKGNAIAAVAPQVVAATRDQWIVSGAFNTGRPFWRVALGDAGGTELYVSSHDGVIRQRTDASARFWNYLGAVPHWLYFTQLRSHVALWTQIVVWSSLAGTLLVAMGLYIGIRQLVRARRAGRWSPYHGFTAWHHLPGLVFGVFLLSWVFSGFLSMNPWGLLEGGGGAAMAQVLTGRPTVDLATLTAGLKDRGDGLVSVASAPLNGLLFIVAHTLSGAVLRLDAEGREAPLTPADLEFLARQLHATAPALLTQGDDYYFSHDGEDVTLPAYRLIAADGTRYYVDAASGQLRQSFDAQDRAYRWWQQGLHRLDFTAAWRARPVWDVGVLILLAGVTFLVGSGVIVAVRYLMRRT